ncbi:BQ5605_C014g07637 [Microbotryum silenes-dioicae]|uniref:DIS3-like exonuclease 2 n=1 Tax=Microbotryum silenes-dioicae TaxID=796604 RepID=A0A2X0MFS6_9BASI|nr:BQ5605_C014g07637 [Microbotryum silenes-dioicae]
MTEESVTPPPTNTQKKTGSATPKQTTPSTSSSSPNVAANKGAGSAPHSRKGSRSNAEKQSGRASNNGQANASQGVASTKNIISKLQDSPSSEFSSPQASVTNRSGHQLQPRSNSNSPARQRQQAGGGGGPHRKNQASSTTPPASAPMIQTLSSSLNPQAGGFQPNLLGPIHDSLDESLVTPTATHFDLMEGVPRSAAAIARATKTGSGAGAGAAAAAPRQYADFSAMGAIGPGAEFVGGFAAAQSLGAGGNGARVGGFGFSFPPATSTQQQYAQMQAAQLQGPFGQQTAQQQAATGVASQASELLSEQLAIQQQLTNLRIQQEQLLARFGDMQQQQLQAASGVEPTQPVPVNIATSNPPPSHRRGQSAFSSFGSGGGASSFGQMGSFNAGPIVGSASAASGNSSAAGLPKGHGRRHSVNTKALQQQQHQQPTGQPDQQTLSSSFQFPNHAQDGNHNSMNDRNQQRLDFNTSNDQASAGRACGHQRRQSGSMSSLGGWQASFTGPGQHQANLAEASAHLQQLAAYRASAGHARVPSFGMSTLGQGPGQLAMASYGGGLPPPGQHNQQGNQARKTLFAPYLPQASIPPLVQAGKLVIGTLRVNKRNRSDAYVATDTLDSDIYICGSKDRNRALEGDLVAVELLDVDEVWGTKKDKEEKKRKKEENASYDPRATRDLRKIDKKKDDVEVEGQGMLLFEDEEVNDDQKPQYAGHIVAVVERAPGQLFSGMLGVLRPSSAATQQKQESERREREGVDLRSGNNNSTPSSGNASQQQPYGGGGNHVPAPRIIWFRPTDKRVPLIAIPTDQAPEDFIECPDKYASRLFLGSIKRWPKSSLHPFGGLVEELGEIGDIEAETNALLKNCNFSNDDFSDAVVKCLPPIRWSIPEREQQPEVRRDFRDQRVFTIDPETAKDLDDALHVVELEDGTFEVGVHIADVSHFVRPNTALDREVRKRGTTVYLVQRAVPLLPPTLSEELCSLNPRSDKLTFSVVWKMTREGKVLSTWFGKTLINSRAKLAYSDVQEVLEGRDLVQGKFETEQERLEAIEDIKRFNMIARNLKKERFENGALRIDNVKVSFKLDEDGQPEDCDHYVRKEANELIEEFMLLANMSVARKIATALPDQALLRRHEPPIDRRLDGFIERMGRLGIKLDGSGPGALMNSFNQVTDEASRTTLQHLSKRSMQQAKYFCTGTLDISKYSHYALNVPLYTHFTSPIRRYADVIVHRQLEAILGHQAAQEAAHEAQQVSVGEPKFSLDVEAVSKIASMCNIKKMNAKLAQEQSQHLMLCVLVHDLTKRYGPVIRPAVVIGVLDQAFDVLVVEFGIEKRVHVDQMPTESTQYDEHDNSLSIYWKKNVEVLGWLAEKNNDEHLLRIRDQAEFHARGLGNHADKKSKAESALFDDDEDDEEPADGQRKQPLRMTGQRLKSLNRMPLKFEGLSDRDQHCIQTVRELQTVPVVITSDMTKSPPVIKVHAINPSCSI